MNSLCVLEGEFTLRIFLEFNFLNFCVVSENAVNTKQKGTICNVQGVLQILM